MIIETKIKTLLVDHGLFEDMAEKVITALKNDPANAMMVSRWGDEESEYPAMIMTVAWNHAKREALKIIDKECPKHWARLAFVEESEDAGIPRGEK